MLRSASVVLVLLLLTAGPLQALPKFASRLNVSCKSCHVNPTGGGLRNAFGISYGQDDLPIPTWRDQFALEEYSTQLNDNISIGANFRTLYFLQQTSGPSSRSSFFQMQSDLYLSARIAKKTSIYLNRGIGNRFEAFGIAGILPADGYVKAGWFVPNVGLRVDDHNIFTRDKTIFAFGGGQDAGVEFGVAPGPFEFTAGVTNGAAGDRDDNGFRAIMARGEGRFKVGDIHLRGGGSYYNNPRSTGVLTLLGVHGAATVNGNLTVLAEYVQRRTLANSVKTYANVFYVEADYVLTPGVDAKVGYEFYDPDTRFASGTESRIVVGLELYLIGGVEFRPLYVFRTETPSDTPNDQFIAMLHFFL